MRIARVGRNVYLCTRFEKAKRMMRKTCFVLLALICQAVVMATPLDDLTNEALTDTSKVVDLDEVVVVAQPKEQFSAKCRARAVAKWNKEERFREYLDLYNEIHEESHHT